MEGLKVLSEARSAEGVGTGEGHRSPSPAWESRGYAPARRKFFSKINVEIVYFSAFLQAEMVFFCSGVKAELGTKWTNNNVSLCNTAITLPDVNQCAEFLTDLH